MRQIMQRSLPAARSCRQERRAQPVIADLTDVMELMLTA
jgi:hypothetical protein